jgi:hypothetical protein
MRKLAVTFIAVISVVLLAGLLGCGQAKSSITTTSLPSGEVDIAYSQTLEASGGSGTYTTWSITSGTLPDGLSLNSSTGVISGTPTTTGGPTTITVQVTDSKGRTGSEYLSITILVTPTITTTSLPNGEVDIAYSQTLEASGGSSTYTTWSVMAGTPPAGLSLDSSTGVISGTPTTSGYYAIAVTVTDSLEGTSSDVFYITIG